MKLPTPDNPAASPVWENYVVAQAAHAALRIVPPYAHAVGVEVNGKRVSPVVQVPLEAPERDVDIEGIACDLQELLGPAAVVHTRIDVRPVCTLSADDGVRWFFATRP